MENAARRSFRVLTINAGSSSVKFAVFDTSANTQLFKSALARRARGRRAQHPGAAQSAGHRHA